MIVSVLFLCGRVLKSAVSMADAIDTIAIRSIKISTGQPYFRISGSLLLTHPKDLCVSGRETDMILVTKNKKKQKNKKSKVKYFNAGFARSQENYNRQNILTSVVRIKNF